MSTIEHRSEVPADRPGRRSQRYHEVRSDSGRGNRAERNRLVRAFFSTGGLHVALLALSFTMVLPFLWMVLTSLKTLAEVDAEAWMPQQAQWSNYLLVFQQIPFARFYLNSLFVTGWITFLTVFSSALAAFSFSRLKWPGRDKVFFLYLATMMLPFLITMVPTFQIMISLHLVDTFPGLIFPAAFSAFGTFLLRQFMLTIPASLDEAAEMDGASKWYVFWEIILPLARPGLITLTIFTFIGNYQNLFWPLVMLRSVEKYTLPLGLLYFDSTQGQETHLLMAAVTMSVIPMIVLFVLLQKQLVKGIQLGGVKG